MNASAYGMADDYPFLNSAPSWQCVHINSFVLSSVTITCSLYDGQPVPCNSGTFGPHWRSPQRGLRG